MTTPKFLGPDNVLRENFSFSTTIPSRFFSGEIDSDTVDIEVSIFGESFTSDPDLVTFEEDSFTIPNPSVFPDGLELISGSNEILVRTISSNGTTSAPASVIVRLVTESDIGFTPNPPTNISVERLDGKVRINAEALEDSRVIGYNFYASRFAGGGVSGYSQINLNLQPVNAPSKEEVTSLGTLNVDASIPLDGNNNPLIDPLFYKIRGDQVDENDSLVQSDFNQLLEVPETVRDLKISVEISSVDTQDIVYFNHIRSGRPTSDFPTIPNGDFAATPSTDPLYYVVTAVYYDSSLGLEIESSNSIEVSGAPVIVTANLGSLPRVNRQQIVTGIIESIIRVRPEIKVEAGSVVRDTVIDPVSSEIERIRIIADYVHRAQAFPTLLEIDDPFGTGESIDVEASSFKTALKQAFFLTSNQEVQDFIDLSFDRLASRFGVTRRLGRRSRGEVTFFTNRRPNATINIPIGTVVAAGSTEFRTTSFARIPFENVASFFDPVTGRYSITVPIQAQLDGSQSNVSAGQIRQVISGPPTLSVVNNSPTFGGEDLETNLDLATRAQSAIASVDSGTRRGYLKIAADVPGVIQAKVIEAGDPLMQRDLDESTGEHRGGKVDIWVQGDLEGTVSDTFAFTFDVARDIQFDLVSTLPELQFRAADSTLSLDNPILQIIDLPDLGLGLRNATTGEFFDLTDAEFTSFDTIKLSTDVTQPSVSITDIILGDYRYRTGTEFILTRQPVRDVLSVTGSQSGTLSSEVYSLVRPFSPLKEGKSTLAGNFLQITDPGDGSGPSGDLISVTGEEHVLIGEFQEFLDNLGANSLTLQVFNEDRTIEYIGPNDPSGTPDYTIIEGDQTTPVAIKRVVSGNISSGETVLIDYSHEENFTVSYTLNLIPQTVQSDVDDKKHLTADVLVKEAIEVPIDISATVVLLSGESPSEIDTFIRTDLESFISGLRLGVPVRVSDIISVIERVQGVSFVVVDTFQMYRSEGSLVVREVLSTDQLGDFTLISEYSNNINNVWLLNEELNSATTNGGGDTSQFRGVFKDDLETTLEIVRPDLLSDTSNQSYIIGNDGLIIPGFSDNSTLSAQGFVTAAEIQQQRVNITKNRVMISLPIGQSPSSFTYSVTYLTGLDSGANNIEPGDAEIIILGDVEFTFDEDR